jgi:cytochrome P450
VTERRDIERILADPGFEVPAAPPGDRGLAWLRATVSRFVNGEAHARRRALVELEIARLDPEALRRDARVRTEAVLDAAEGRVEAMTAIARRVPLAALAHALGVPDERLDAVVGDAIAVAPAYPTGATGSTGEGVDAAADRLRELLDRGDPEATAAAIAVLAQACEATAGAIGNAMFVASERPELRGDAGALLRKTLLRASPLRVMRRVSPAGEPVTLDVEAASDGAADGDPSMAFGSGVRPCPGAAQAVALVGGVLDALLPRCAVDPDGLAWADLPALRLPERLELLVS